MALIECRECKNPISSQATACPKCGMPTAVPGETAAPPDELSPKRIEKGNPYKRKENKNKTPSFIIVAVLLIAVGVVWIMSKSGGKISSIELANRIFTRHPHQMTDGSTQDTMASTNDIEAWIGSPDQTTMNTFGSLDAKTYIYYNNGRFTDSGDLSITFINNKADMAKVGNTLLLPLFYKNQSK